MIAHLGGWEAAILLFRELQRPVLLVLLLGLLLVLLALVLP